MDQLEPTETLCKSCDAWSPSTEWGVSDSYDEDGEWMEQWAVCPSCGYAWPYLDPPSRPIPYGGGALSDAEDRTRARESWRSGRAVSG